jgi:hypothetical protein
LTGPAPSPGLVLFGIEVPDWHLKLRRGPTLAIFDFGSAKKSGRYRPYVFTEQGVAMLSSVLSSTRAVQVNIAIMRALVQRRQMMERKYDDQFKVVFSANKRLRGSRHRRRRRSAFDRGFVKLNACPYSAAFWD